MGRDGARPDVVNQRGSVGTVGRDRVYQPTDFVAAKLMGFSESEGSRPAGIETSFEPMLEAQRREIRTKRKASLSWQ